MPKFSIPRKLRDLERERDDELFAGDVPDVDSVGPKDIDAACKVCSVELSNGPLNILDQQTFDATYTIVRNPELLDRGHVERFTTTMCQNLSVLVTRGLEELSAEGRDKVDPVVGSHCSAIHAYAFFLHVIHESLHARMLDSQKAEASAKAPNKRGGKAKKAVQEEYPGGDGLTAAWPRVVDRIMKALSRTLKAHLDDVLYRSTADKCRLVEICVLTVTRCMEDSSIVKQEDALTACLEVVVLSATRHANATGCLELAAEAIFRLVKGHEHGPSLAIRASVLAADKYESPSLGKAMVAKFCELEPEGYDDMASHDTKQVKRAAEMLSGMAAALPAVLHACISQLMPYFGCKTAATIRSNLVDCMGRLMEWYMARGMDEKGSRLLQMSRQNAVRTLVERVNDMAALVRKAALNTIEDLAERHCWPIEYVVVAARAAVARLDDGALPAGAALSLLCRLVHVTAKTQLTDTFLVGSLNRFEEDLKGMKPDVMEVGEDAQDSGPQWESGALGGEDGQGEQGQQAAGGQDPGPSSQQTLIMPTQLEASTGGAPPAQPPPTDGKDKSGGGGHGGMTYSQVRLLIASLKELLELSRTLAAALPEVEALLASDSADVAERAIQLLTLCSQKQLQGVAESWRRVWHLVFSASEKVRETVLDAFYNFLLPGNSITGFRGQEQHRCMVNKLVQMVGDLALCDQEALEELMRLAVTGMTPGQNPMFGAELVRMMLGDLKAVIIRATLLERDGADAATEAQESRLLAGRLSLLCGMVARHAPQLVVPEVENLIAHLKRSHIILKDALLVRNLALMLRDIAPALHASPKGIIGGGKYQPASHIPNALTNLLSVLVSGHLPHHGGLWAPAAQAAMAAIYRLHPEPHTLLGPLMQHLAVELAGVCAPATQIARAVFLVGCIATQQLALIDTLAKRVRQERIAQEKAAEKASADDMAAQLGTGQAREHQLDALQEELEARLLGNSLISMWGKLVSELCHAPALMGLHPDLASAAMTTLAKFMALDANYCEDNCPIFFTRLTGGNIKLERQVRCGMLVALGDLGRRHPNVMEPWTERMFVCLNDEDEEVAKTCLRILAHLILSDMTKPKGHMAHVARCLVARSTAVRDLAIRLFNSLSKKQAKGGANKVYQYLPEIISTVTRGDPISEEDYQAMMQRLLSYVKADKLADKLKERLCERFQNVVCEFATSTKASAVMVDAGIAAPFGATGRVPVPSVSGCGGGGCSSSSSSYEDVVREWRFLAACIALIPYCEKGLRTCMDSMRCYKHALGDEYVYQVFKGIAEHARRGNRTAELKQEVTDYEARLLEVHNSLREEQLQQAAVAAAAAAAAKAAADAQAKAETSIGSSSSEGEKQQEAQQADIADEQPGGTEAAGDDEGSGESVEGHGGTEWGGGDTLRSGIVENITGGDGDGTTKGADDGPASMNGVHVGDYDKMVSVDGGDDVLYGEKPEEEDGDVDGAELGEAAEEGEPQGEGEEEMEQAVDEEVDGEGDGAFTDAEMEWEEGSTEGSRATPLACNDMKYNGQRAAPSPGSFASGMPMTMAFATSEKVTPGENMAWSPAPSCAAGKSHTAVTRPCLQENVKPEFPGFHIKPDPDGSGVERRNTPWPLGGALGVRIKADPDGRWRRES